MKKENAKKEEVAEEKVAAAAAEETVAEKEECNEKIQGETVVRNDLTVVVTYCEGKDDADMLKYAVRSVQKNLVCVDANVLVLGNKKPDFVKPEDFVHADIKSMDDPADQWRVAKLLLDNKDVNDDIVLISPGMVVCSPCLLANIAVVKASPSITTSVQVLRELGFHAENYNTHMPAFITKDMMATAVRFDDVKACDLITTLLTLWYRDYVKPHVIETKNGAWKTGPWLLPVVSREPQIATLEHYFECKQFAFFSENSRGRGVKDFLERKFPEKSCIEID